MTYNILCRLFSALVTLFFATTIFAQAGSTAVPFLLIAPNARASGMGEAGTAISDDVSALYWNPAGLAFQRGEEISITHSQWLPQFNSDLFYDYINYKKHLVSVTRGPKDTADSEEEIGTVGGSITFLNLGQFVRTDETSPAPKGTFRSFEFAVAAAYATSIGEDLGGGVAVRYIQSQLSSIGTGQEKGNGVGQSVSFDIGVLWKPKQLDFFGLGDVGGDMNFGATLANLGPKITYVDVSQADPLPTTIRLGVAAQLVNDEYNRFVTTIDVGKVLVHRSLGIDSVNVTSDPLPKSLVTSWDANTVQSLTFAGGAEYWYDNTIALRAGYFYESPKYGNREFITLGAGIRYNTYQFDFSYINTIAENHPLGNTLRFTLGIKP